MSHSFLDFLSSSTHLRRKNTCLLLIPKILLEICNQSDVNDQSYHFLHSIECTQIVTKHHLHYFLRFLSPAMIFCLIFTSLISFSVKTSLNLITLEEIFGWLCIVTLTNLNSYMHVIYISLLYNTCTYMYIFYR